MVFKLVEVGGVNSMRKGIEDWKIMVCIRNYKFIILVFIEGKMAGVK